MPFIDKLGFLFLFLSLPLVAALKGKGIIVSFVLFCFLLKAHKTIWIFLCTLKQKSINYKRLGCWIFLMGGFVLLFCSSAVGVITFLKVGAIVFLTTISLKSLQEKTGQEKTLITKIFFFSFVFYVLFFLFELYGPHLISKGYGHKRFDISDWLNIWIRATVILTFLCIPFLSAVSTLESRKKWIWLCFSLISLLLIIKKAQPSAAVLALASGGFFYICTKKTKIFRPIFFLSTGLWVIVAPFFFTGAFFIKTAEPHMADLPPSYQHRVQIWKFFSEKAFEKPWLGHGISYRLRESPSYPRLDISTKKDNLEYTLKTRKNNVAAIIPKKDRVIVRLKESVLTNHPHSGPVQIWFESGFVGVLMFLIFLCFLNKVIKSVKPRLEAPIMALLGVYFIYWNMSFGQWQTWILSLVALTILLIHTINGLPSEKGSSHV